MKRKKRRFQRTVKEELVREGSTSGEDCFRPLEGTENRKLIAATPFPLGQRCLGMGEDICPARAGTDSPTTTHVLWVDWQYHILVLKQGCAGKYLKTLFPEQHKALICGVCWLLWCKYSHRGCLQATTATPHEIPENVPVGSNERAPSLGCVNFFFLQLLSL